MKARPTGERAGERARTARLRAAACNEPAGVTAVGVRTRAREFYAVRGVGDDEQTASADDAAVVAATTTTDDVDDDDNMMIAQER